MARPRLLAGFARVQQTANSGSPCWALGMWGHTGKRWRGAHRSTFPRHGRGPWQRHAQALQGRERRPPPPSVRKGMIPKTRFKEELLKERGEEKGDRKQGTARGLPRGTTHPVHAGRANAPPTQLPFSCQLLLHRNFLSVGKQRNTTC